MRLDILIYAHDGRGLGHISRSVGIGLALRRLYPDLRVLFVSGSNFTGELIGRAPLDWIKLPSYKTSVVDGKSTGVDGDSGFSDQELGKLRSNDLAHIVGCYRPRLALVDHSPQGKHRELLAALEAGDGITEWILGVRGVVGDVQQIRSNIASKAFARHYKGLLWYGDQGVLGEHQCLQLEKQYKSAVVPCGYVCRLREYLHFNRLKKEGETWAGVVSVPWLGEKSHAFLKRLAQALEKVPPAYGSWSLFMGQGEDDNNSEIDNLFSHLPHCVVKEPGSSYGYALMHAKSALIYGGYNSLVDVLFTQLPALVLLREMQDREQQQHLAALEKKMGGMLTSLSENEVSSDGLAQLLVKNLYCAKRDTGQIEIDGATKAANYLYSRLIDS